MGKIGSAVQGSNFPSFPQEVLAFPAHCDGAERAQRTWLERPRDPGRPSALAPAAYVLRGRNTRLEKVQSGPRTHIQHGHGLSLWDALEMGVSGGHALRQAHVSLRPALGRFLLRNCREVRGGYAGSIIFLRLAGPGVRLSHALSGGAAGFSAPKAQEPPQCLQQKEVREERDVPWSAPSAEPGRAVPAGPAQVGMATGTCAALRKRPRGRSCS